MLERSWKTPNTGSHSVIISSTIRPSIANGSFAMMFSTSVLSAAEIMRNPDRNFVPFKGPMP